MGLPFYGTAVYRIEEAGLLEGVFTNVGSGGQACYEIAKKKEALAGLEGVYDTSYTDFDGKSYGGTLIITFEDNHYELCWEIVSQGNSPVSLFFKGLGEISEANRLVVSYRQVQDLPCDYAGWRSATPLNLKQEFMNRRTVIVTKEVIIAVKNDDKTHKEHSNS